MQDAERKLLSLLMPEGLLEYGYENSKLESKGFMPSTEISDFPIRGQKVTLHIRRRCWTVLDTGQIITRDWNLVREGTRMTTEFGLFLKKIFG
ncbi:MAG: hypothetical protein K0S31_4783 [Sphingobacterium multivorum]|nr:hypothetical protein [Sphingobacterium multivorum]